MDVDCSNPTNAEKSAGVGSIRFLIALIARAFQSKDQHAGRSAGARNESGRLASSPLLLHPYESLWSVTATLSRGFARRAWIVWGPLSFAHVFTSSVQFC